ncbi:MAG: hypothetical protein H6705_18810, partial [Myxococcales bacterium]|nr:hypothetical protein [Myxococcales bacterium]
GHLRDYLEKGWAGDTQGGGKSLAKALAAVAVELLTWLTFKVGSVALKGAKTVAKGVSKGAQSLAKGASRAGKAIAGGVRRAGQYVIKQGKVLLKGIAGTALGRAAKRLDDFARGLLGKTRFKGFRIRVRQRWFILEGKINPWIPIAEGPFPQRQTLAKTSDEIDGVIAQLKASDRVGSAKIAGAETTSAHDLLDDIARRAKLGEHGAQGELAALERRVLKDGNDVDLLRAVEKGDDARFTRDGARSRGNKTGEPNPRTTPDIRTKGDTPELIDVKTAVKAPKNWKRWINDQIAKVHDQMKRSRLRSGRPGGADLQLFEEAAEAFSTLGRTEVDNFVKGAFNAHRGTSLNRVTIYCDGNVAAEYIRVGDIIKVVK